MGVKKVLWKDGLFVVPQHFQQSERYLADLSHQAVSALSPYRHGFYHYSIDPDALASGMLSVHAARGMMPDGTPFSIPHQEASPPVRSIEEHFGHHRSSLDVSLALPLVQDGRGVLLDGPVRMETRYRPATVAVVDEVYGRASEQIELAVPDFVVRFEGEALDGMTWMRIARVKRAGDGGLRLDEEFIPPLVRINASSPYMQLVESLLRSLHAKGAELRQGRRQGPAGFAEFTADELTVYGLLNTICTYVPLLDEAHARAAHTHPYRVHTVLTMLAGSLQTFVAGREIPPLPVYDHDDIAAALTPLHRIIRGVLDADYSTRCVTLELCKSGAATYTCTVPDRSLLTDADLYIGVSAAAPDEELMATARRVIKLGARDQLPRLTISATPGLPLVPVHTPPPDLAGKAGWVYLKLCKEGIHWEAILSSHAIAFTFPTRLTDLAVELLAVKPS
jgi:type VI secretion system protein ImpJ